MKKLLSLILSFCLALSTFSCFAGVASAEESQWFFNGAAADVPEEVPFSIGATSVGTRIEIDSGYRNILYEKDYELRCHHEDGTQCNNIWFDKSYGLANSHLDNVDINPSSRATYPEVDVIFDLAAAVTPEYFAFINRPETSLQTAEFEVYVADTYEEAISEPELLINYTRPNDTTTDHHVNVYKFPENPDKFNYLIVRLKKDNYGGYDGYRLNDIMLFGQDPSLNAGEWVYTGSAANTPAENFPLVQGDPLSVGTNLPVKDGYTNLLPGKTYEVYCHHYDDSADCSGVYTANLDKMSNGVITNIDVAPPSSARAKYPEVDILFDLEKETVPEYFLFINRSLVKRQIIEFDLLGANTYEEAKTSPTLIANYNRGDDVTSDHHVLAYKFPEDTESFRYIILRLKNDTFGDAVGYRFTQIALTGEVVQGGWVYDGSVADMGEDLPVHLSGSGVGSAITFDEGYGNHLIGKDMDVSCYNGETKCTNIYGEDTWNKTANGLMDNVDYNPSSIDTYNEVNLIFDLKGTVAPEYFVLINRATTNQQTNKYEIYGANSYEEARLNPTLIATYERNPQDNTTDKQVNIFEFTEDFVGFKYFVVRLLDDNYEGPNSGYRLMELMLLGDYIQDPAGVEIGYFEDNLDNVLDSTKALTAEKITYLQNEEACTLQASKESNLQDGNLETEAYFSYKFAEYDQTTDTAIWYTDGTRTMEIVYDLGGKFNLCDLLITHHKGISWRASEYELYASKERDGLFADESLVTKVYNPVPAQNQVVFPNLDKSVRYVALKYINPVSTTDIQKVKDGNIYPRIYEFRVYGTEADCNGNHNVVQNDRVEPDMFTDGMEAHYSCTECDVIFSDSEGLNAVNPKDYVIPATGYPYHESYEEGQNFKLQHLMDFNGDQGAAVYGDTLFSFNRVGRAAVYDIPSQKYLGGFNLASHNDGKDPDGNTDARYANHCNATTFSNVKFDESDPFPLLYVATGTSGEREADGANISKLAVERILYSEATGWYSELVQLIEYNDYDYLLPDDDSLVNNWNGEAFKYISYGDYDASKGYERGLNSWFNTFVDYDPTGKTNGKFYRVEERFDTNPANLSEFESTYLGFESFEESNALIISEFELPSLPASEDDPAYGGTVVLNPSHITDQFTLEHRYGVDQGGVVYKGILYFLRGNCSVENLYYRDYMEAIDLQNHQRVGDYKLYESEAWCYEPESLCIWNGELLMTMGSKGFVFDYVTLDTEGQEHVCSLCGKNLRKHTVSFHDKMGNLLLETQVYEDDFISAEILQQAEALIPSIFGYDAGVNGNLWSNDTSSAITSDLSFTAIYTRKELVATLTVADSGNTSVTEYTFDERVTLTAADPQSFLGWQNTETGAIVSKSATYKLYMPGDLSLTAVYKDAETDSLELDQSILNSTAHYESGAERYNVTVMANAILPEGAEIIEKGIVFTNQTGFNACDGVITLDMTAKKQIAKATLTAPGNYMITLTGVKNDQVRYARSYLTYLLEGSPVTVYSRNTLTIG